MGSTPTPDDNRRHTLAREANHAEEQHQKTSYMAKVAAENGDYAAARENRRQADNARRMADNRRKTLYLDHGVTDPKAEGRRLVVEKGLSFPDKGSVNATEYDGPGA